MAGGLLLFGMSWLAISGICAPTLVPLTHLHAERSFTITLHARPDVAVRAFGPVSEQCWSPEWHPRFIYPASAKDVEGAVFAVDDERTQTWLLQRWDMARRVVRYIVFDPGVKLTEIDIRVTPIGVQESRAKVTYKRTALSARGDALVADFARHFVHEAPHWEAAINAYLARKSVAESE